MLNLVTKILNQLGGKTMRENKEREDGGKEEGHNL
jgi:hypothetical protein